MKEKETEGRLEPLRLRQRRRRRRGGGFVGDREASRQTQTLSAIFLDNGKYFERVESFIQGNFYD